jgi:hypothetical protein
MDELGIDQSTVWRSFDSIKGIDELGINQLCG